MTGVLHAGSGTGHPRLVLTPTTRTAGRHSWTAADADSGTRLGQTSLIALSQGIWRLEFEARPSTRGRAACAVAAHAATRFAFDHLAARRLVWSGPVGAHGNRLTVYRLGFAFDGTVRASEPPHWHMSLGAGALRALHDPPPDFALATLRARVFAAPPPVLRVDGIPARLRRFAPADAAAFREACDQESSAAWTSITRPYPIVKAQRFIEQYAAGGWAEGLRATFAVDDGTGRCVGDAEIRLRQDDLGTGDLGVLLHPECRGRGWASALCGALCDWAGAALGLRRIEAQVFVRNVASRRMLEQVGFALEGTLRSHGLLNWVATDRWILTLLPEDRTAASAAGRQAATVRGVHPASSTQQGPSARA